MTKTKLAFLIIVLLAVFTHFYRLSATLIFLEDQGRDLLIVKYMLDHRRPVLLGPQTSTGNLYLGPLYYYLITPFLYLARMHPLGPTIFIALTGIATSLLLFYILSPWFGRKIAFLASLLYAILPLPVQFTRNSWNPNLAPFISLLLIFFLDRLFTYRLHRKQKLIHFLILGFLFGTLIQLHYMSLALLPPVCLLLLYRYRHQLWFFMQGSLLTFVSFCLTLSPLVLFEFRHDWLNTKAFLRFILAKDADKISYSLHLSRFVKHFVHVFSYLVDGLFGLSSMTVFSQYTVGIVIIFTLLLFIFLAYLLPHPRTFYKKRIIYLSFLFLVPLFIISFYQGTIHLHYLGFLFVIPYILVSTMVFSSFLPLALFSRLFLLFSLVISVPYTFTYLHSGPSYQLEKAQQVAQFISYDAASYPYNITSRIHDFITPYQYFLSLTPNPPTTHLTDTLYLICQDSPCSQQDIDSSMLFVQGPAHPYLKEYVGHPVVLELGYPRDIVFSQHVSHGIWVTKLHLHLNQ